jgi:hypothetical protein
MKFLINGYWKNDKTEFYDYVVTDYDDNAEDDDEIFYFGLSESEIREAIKHKEDTALEFVITGYETLSTT